MPRRCVRVTEMPNYLVQAQRKCDHELRPRPADGRVTTYPRWDSERGLAWPDAGEPDQPRAENRDPYQQYR